VVVIPTNLLVSQRFHHDEALYATWALHIVSGQDVWLAETPIDKPPLSIYLMALFMWCFGPTETVARIPSLIATVLIVWLTYCLGNHWYDTKTGILAAWLVSLSPYTIAFAPTALTDPLLVCQILASCWFVSTRRMILAGLCCGLAWATKQQAIFFLPLIIGSGLYPLPDQAGSNIPPALVRGKRLNFNRDNLTHFLLGSSSILLLLFAWDASRTDVPNFLTHSANNYGGLRLDLWGFSERLTEFVDLLQFATGSRLLNLLFLGGLLGVLLTRPFKRLTSTWQRKAISLWHPSDDNLTSGVSGISPAGRNDRGSHFYDWLLALFCLFFLLCHAFLSLQIWARYLLGLIPFLALLMARILLLPHKLARHLPIKGKVANCELEIENFNLQFIIDLTYYVPLTLLLGFTLMQPIQDTIHGRYPLATNTASIQGIEQMVAYLQGNFGTNTTLYHHWLGTHWRFYLWHYPYDLQFWETPDELADHAQPQHLIAFPAWRSETEARLTLSAKGLTLVELMRVHTVGGVPSIILYQIERMASFDDKASGDD